MSKSMSHNNLRPEDIDRLGQAVLTLTQELWITRDRLRIMEAALADTGLLKPETLDRYQPDEKLSEALRDERARLIEQVLGALEST